MGKDKNGNWNYDLDPLAGWLGVEAIVDLACASAQPARRA
jgi:hypothetical protein